MRTSTSRKRSNGNGLPQVAAATAGLGIHQPAADPAWTNKPTKPMGPDPLARHVQEILGLIGEDPERQGLLRTPERVTKALRELTSGYGADVDKILNGALFSVEYSEMVLVKDITFYALCEHHLLPFFGKAHVAYVPNRSIVGLSKIPRLVGVFARRLQVQERMTQQIAETLMRKLDPLGVGVILEARHLCMEMRGAQSQLSPTVTSAMLGNFRKDIRTREEFLTLIRS